MLVGKGLVIGVRKTRLMLNKHLAHYEKLNLHDENANVHDFK
jgi:hypothetical protein